MSYRHKNLALSFAILAALAANTNEAAARTAAANPDSKAPDTAAIDALNSRLARLEKYLGAQEEAPAQDDPEAHEQVATLEQRLLVLERKLELQQEEAAMLHGAVLLLACRRDGGAGGRTR